MATFLIDGDSQHATKSELDLFSLPATQVAIQRGFYDEVQLTNACTNEGPYELRVPPDQYMLGLRKNLLYMQLRIVQAAGTALAAGVPTVGPINAIAKTFFNQIKIFINSKMIYDSGPMYHYRAYLETELNYTTEAKASHQQAGLYYADQENNYQAAGNTGFVSRKGSFAASAWVEVAAPIHGDLFIQERYLVNNCDLRIELHRNRNPFCLMCFDQNPNAYKIEVQQMKWYVRKVEVIGSLALGYEQVLAKMPAKYPIRRVQISSVHVNTGARSCPTNAILQGQIPRRMIIGMAETAAFHGSYGTNPFYFQHFNTTHVRVIAGGQTYPVYSLESNFDDGHYIRNFVSLFETLGIYESEKGNGLSRARYGNGTTSFGIDLTPDCDDGEHWELIKDGSVSLDIQFSVAVPAGGIEVIIYAEYDNLVTIDRNRVANFDYSA